MACSDERGGALVSALLICSLMLFTGTAIISRAVTEVDLSAREVSSAGTLFLAESGVAEALNELDQNSTYTTGQTAPSFSDNAAEKDWVLAQAASSSDVDTTSNGEYVWVVPSGSDVIYAVGYSPSRADPRVKRVLRVGREGETFPQAFSYAIFSNTDLSLTGNATTDSTPVPNQGDIGTNGNLSMSGNATVNGDASAGGSVSSSGNADVTGGSTESAPPVPLPPVDTSTWQSEAANPPTGQTIIGNVSISSDTALTQRYITGNLSISGGEVTVSGIVWVAGNVSLSGNCTVVGTGSLVAEGTISISGNANATFSNPNADVAFISLSTASNAISVSGNADTQGVFYAPNGGISLTGNGHIKGAVVAQTVTVSGNGIVYQDSDLPDSSMPLPMQSVPADWREL